MLSPRSVPPLSSLRAAIASSSRSPSRPLHRPLHITATHLTLPPSLPLPLDYLLNHNAPSRYCPVTNQKTEERGEGRGRGWGHWGGRHSVVGEGKGSTDEELAGREPGIRGPHSAAHWRKGGEKVTAEVLSVGEDEVVRVHAGGQVEDFPADWLRSMSKVYPGLKRGDTKRGDTDGDAEAALKEDLQQYRLTQSDGKLAFFVFTNAVLEGIIRTLPANAAELLMIKGIGPMKLELYGDDILRVVAKYADPNREFAAIPNQPTNSLPPSTPPEMSKAALKEDLRQYRLTKSDGKSAFTVFTNAALEGIIGTLPANAAELLMIKGIGPAKLELYGDDILRVVAKYADPNREFAAIPSSSPAASSLPDPLTLSYADFLASPKNLHSCLDSFFKVGYFRLSDLPPVSAPSPPVTLPLDSHFSPPLPPPSSPSPPLSAYPVHTIATLVSDSPSPSHSSLYGPLFNVVSDPNPTNIAYTNKELKAHQDLVYYESPPGVQILHCVEAAAEGGDSTLIDAVEAAEWIRISHPRLFRALTLYPVTFIKQRSDPNTVMGSNANLSYTVPIVQVDPLEGGTVGLRWAPQFEGSLIYVQEIWEDFIEGEFEVRKRKKINKLALLLACSSLLF